MRAGRFVAAAALLVAGAVAAWYLRVTPSDLTAVDWVVPPAAGDWIAVSGRARFRGDERPVLFESLATRDFLRAGYRIPAGGNLPVFSADGKTAAWTTSRLTLRGETAYVVHMLKLDSERPVRTAWGAPSLRENPLMVFSDDGSRMAVITAESIAVSDLPGRRRLFEAHPRQPLWLWGSRGYTTATFADRDRLRVYCVRDAGPPSREATLDILEFELAGSRLSQVGHAGPFSHIFPLLSDSRRERLLVRETARAILLIDARSGNKIREFAEGSVTSRSADFLSDGRIALFESESGRVRFQLLDPTGSPVRSVPLGPGERAFFVGEPRTGFVDAAVAFAAGLRRRDARIVRIDLARGTAVTIADHLFPVTTFSRWTGGDPGRTFAPGSTATRIFYGPNDSLVELDAGTNRARTVLGTSVPR